MYGIVTPPCLHACLHPIVQLGNRKLAHILLFMQEVYWLEEERSYTSRQLSEKLA